jgi:hypothetical protein
LPAGIHDALNDGENVEAGARRSIRVMVATSPGARSFTMRMSSRRSACAPLVFSRKRVFEMSAGTKPQEYLKLDLVDGVEGPLIYLCDYRIPDRSPGVAFSVGRNTQPSGRKYSAEDEESSPVSMSFTKI